MLDLDVTVDPLEVALDSEQVRSVNQLLALLLEFKRKDNLLRTRPREAISKYLETTAATSTRSVNGQTSSISRRSSLGGKTRGTSLGIFGQLRTASERPNTPAPRQVSAESAAARRELIRAWWIHAFQGVRYLCKIPKSNLSKQELLERTHLRDTYMGLCMDIEEAQERERADGLEPQASLKLKEQVQKMQMQLALQDILEWRMMAGDKRRESLGSVEEEEDALAKEAAEKERALAAKAPSTLQARMHFASFNAYFMGVADSFWERVSGPAESPPGSPTRGTLSSPSSPSSNRRRRRLTRQMIIKGQVLDVRLEVVQKGRSGHRMARWLELGVGSVSATNCNVQGPDHSARQILSILPIESRAGSSPTVCAFFSASTLRCVDRNLEPGDATLGAVLKPWEGLGNHLRDFPQQETPEQVKRLGFLNGYTNELGKLMTFAFVRVGQVRALDHTPFRRRVLHFLARGRASQTTDLVRRPSPLALNRELLVNLQRKVEKLAGKSDMLGIVEGVVDGVRGRLVDHYNSQHVLCKDVSLAPMTWKALRNGKPQAFHLQFHQLHPAGAKQQPLQLPSLMPGVCGDSWGLLPWKVAMLLLPKADFTLGLDLSMECSPQPGLASETSAGVQDATENPDAAVLNGSTFMKWGRNKKFKRRFVYFDDTFDALVWKNVQTDRRALGAIPLHSIQDVCTGLVTPVMQRVRNPALCPDRVLSIIATDRTLDLQAETVAEQQQWVAGLKARYKQHIQEQQVHGEGAMPLPKVLVRRNKAYPDNFRSDRCALKSTYQRLQAVSALGKTLSMPSK
uniref:PH domain-containing protein n=1 Tax=Alexandrium monilatum TaxID=311494 RepID=A0A7S4V2Z9_9DINO